MSTRTEVENLKTSGAEKVLAVVLAAFILIGAIWTYDRIGEIAGVDDGYGYSSEYGYSSRSDALQELDPEDRRALTEADQARQRAWNARNSVRAATSMVELSRENWRAELDAGVNVPELRLAYRNALADLQAARDDLAAARAAVDEAEPAAAVARQELRDEIDDAQAITDREEVTVFLLRLLLVSVMLGGGYVAMSRIRKRRSRLLPLALADIGAGALLAVYMAGDYGSGWGLFENVGPLVLSLVGIVLTVIAFIALQRYLARQIPLRRVRRHECPFCGYPARSNVHCEGCGRRLAGPCSSCEQPRRVGTPRCGNCGSP
jgi:hypothetical protein